MLTYKDKKILKFLIKIGVVPIYTEVSLFLIALSFILVSLGNFHQLQTFLSEGDNIIFLALMFYGIIFSIYHAFSMKEKTDFQKFQMLLFAATMNAVSAGLALEFSLSNNINIFYIIFPILNFSNALFLFIFIGWGSKIPSLSLDLSLELVLSKQAKIYEIIIGSLFILTIFLISQYTFENYWAITLSMCLSYAGMFNEIICRLFLRGIK